MRRSQQLLRTRLAVRRLRSGGPAHLEGPGPGGLESHLAGTFQPGTGITGIVLKVSGSVPGITAAQFAEAAEGAKTGCPVSQALAATPITLEVGDFSA